MNDKLDQMRDMFAKMTPKGIQLVLEGVITKRAKASEKALIFAVGLAQLKQKNPILCEYVFVEIKLMRDGEKIIKEMRKLPIFKSV
jgi:hypothetical protein